MSATRALTAVALAVVVAAMAGAILDYRGTLSRVPPVPKLCRVPTGECEQRRVAQLDARLDRFLALEADFRERSWFYALGVLAGALGLVAVALHRHRTPSERQRVFTYLGVGGVVLGLIVVGLLWLAETETIQPSALIAFFPVGGMLAVAAVGGAIARSYSGRPLRIGAEDTGRGWRRALRYAPWVGLGCTAVTLVLVQLFSGQQPVCGGVDEYAPTPGWTEYVYGAAVATSLAAGLFGLLGLLVGRWALALAVFVANPALLILMILSTCAGY